MESAKRDCSSKLKGLFARRFWAILAVFNSLEALELVPAAVVAAGALVGGETPAETNGVAPAESKLLGGGPLIRSLKAIRGAFPLDGLRGEPALCWKLTRAPLATRTRLAASGCESDPESEPGVTAGERARPPRPAAAMDWSGDLGSGGDDGADPGALPVAPFSLVVPRARAACGLGRLSSRTSSSICSK